MKDFNNLYDEMTELIETFKTEHEKFVKKSNAAAGVRARGAINQLKKIITDYKKKSVEIAKTFKKSKEKVDE
jgi:hypothetical protein